MSHHVRFDDLEDRLDPSRASPYLDTFVSDTKAGDRLKLIELQLGFPEIREFRSKHRYPDDQTYLDLMPIFVSAVCKVFKTMKGLGIDFKGFDARTYLTPFTSEIDIDLGKQDFHELRMRGWGPLDLIPVVIG